MANLKISELPIATPLQGAEKTVVVQAELPNKAPLKT